MHLAMGEGGNMPKVSDGRNCIWGDVGDEGAEVEVEDAVGKGNSFPQIAWTEMQSLPYTKIRRSDQSIATM
jgi:hypothetical protein